MGQEDKVEIDYSRYHNITPELAYTPPYYVHSHSRSLYKAVSQGEGELLEVKKLIEDLRFERQRVEGLVQKTWSELEAKKNNVIQNYGFPIDGKGRPEKLNNILKDFEIEVQEIRKQISNFNTMELNYNKKDSELKSIIDMYGKSVVLELYRNFIYDFLDKTKDLEIYDLFVKQKKQIGLEEKILDS
jgi:hypothetical protein